MIAAITGLVAVIGEATDTGTISIALAIVSPPSARPEAPAKNGLSHFLYPTLKMFFRVSLFFLKYQKLQAVTLNNIARQNVNVKGTML